MGGTVDQVKNIMYITSNNILWETELVLVNKKKTEITEKLLLMKEQTKKITKEKNSRELQKELYSKTRYINTRI